MAIATLKSTYTHTAPITYSEDVQNKVDRLLKQSSLTAVLYAIAKYCEARLDIITKLQPDSEEKSARVKWYTRIVDHVLKTPLARN